MTLIFTVILAALVFTYINGFHDTANSIATVVATKVLTPRQAVMLAAVTNLGGAFIGHGRCQHHCLRPRGPESCHVRNPDLRLVGRHCLEPADLVVWTAVQFVARAGGRLVRRVPGGRTNNWSVMIWSVPSPKHWWKGKGCSGRSLCR